MKTILTLRETAAWLKIPRSTLYQLCQSGRIPCAKVGRHWRFVQETVQAWLQQQERTPVGYCKEPDCDGH